MVNKFYGISSTSAELQVPLSNITINSYVWQYQIFINVFSSQSDMSGRDNQRFDKTRYLMLFFPGIVT